MHISKFVRTFVIGQILLIHSSRGLEQTYCSEENTGSSESSNLYQSNGLCSNTCLEGSYTYAILQGYSCWCSNTLPSTLVSLSLCNETCPGYGYEYCGNSDSNLFGYIYLGLDSIVESASSSSSSFSTSSLDSSTFTSEWSKSSTSTLTSSFYSSTSTTESSTIYSSPSTSETKVASESQHTSSSNLQSSIFSSTETTVTTTASLSFSTSSYTYDNELLSSKSVYQTTQTPVVSVIFSIQTITATPDSNSQSLQVITTKVIRTIYSTASSESVLNTTTSTNQAVSNVSNFWSSPSKVGGTFFAVGFVCLLLLIMLIYFLLKYRKHKQRKAFEKNYGEVIRSATDPYSSSFSLSTDPRPVFYADEKGILNSAGTYNSASPPSPQKAKTDSLQATEDEPLVLDQRLDPRPIISQWENKAGSNVSLADDVDYSRKVLRVTND